MAIEKLTKEKLIEYGVNSETIKQIYTDGYYSVTKINNKGNFSITVIDNLIYSGKDRLRLDYFKENEKPRFPFVDLELLPEYLEKSIEYNIIEARKKAGSIVVEQSIKQRFIENEIEFIKEQIIDCKKYPNRNYKVSLLNTWELSLDWFLNLKHKRQMNNIDEWVDWMTRNPELAEKHYPELMQGLTQGIKNSEPFLTALIIQKLPDHFPKWKNEADQYFGIKRTKMIQNYIDLIKAVLVEYEYPSEIEQQAVKSVRAELSEQLEYWKNETKSEQENKVSKTKQVISNELETIDKTMGWGYAFTNETDYKTFLDLLTCFFEYKPYSIPQQTIRLKRDCKTRFAKELRPIHKDLSEKPLKSDIEFFNLIKTLNHFKDLNDNEIYQAITR